MIDESSFDARILQVIDPGSSRPVASVHGRLLVKPFGKPSIFLLESYRITDGMSAEGLSEGDTIEVAKLGTWDASRVAFQGTEVRLIRSDTGKRCHSPRDLQASATKSKVSRRLRAMK